MAHSAEAHKGRKYQRRTPPELCNWWRGPRVEIGPIPWSDTFAYAVGLFATDGWITIRSNGYSSMGFSSKDRDLTELFRQCLGLTAALRERRRKRWGKIWTCYEISFSSVRLARWFQDIGITPRKSLTIGALKVPYQLFFHTLRGLVDGDGSIARYTDARGRHCFSIRLYSASERHLVWVSGVLSDRLGVTGSLVKIRRKKTKKKRKVLGRQPVNQLAYAREASRTIASCLYADPSAPRLDRKWIRWMAEERSGRF
ncbi:MAG: LAGLIDADG family homing endonuclease [Candidatus Limnocylindria bacterium]